jgi:DNA-binding transcriptional MerR regulator
MRQFIALLREQLPQVAPTQTKYRVTPLPSERTIRFYTANKLVDKPAMKDGAQALYGYRQLLQVMAIKYLQSQYLPLVKIRSLVENASNRDLEQMIPEISPVTAAHRGIAREDRTIVDNSFFPQVIDFTSRVAPIDLSPVESSAAPEDINNLWRRVEVGPGIELHIHASALTDAAIEQLRGALLRELGVLRGWYGKKE